MGGVRAVAWPELRCAGRREIPAKGNLMRILRVEFYQQELE